MSAIRLSSNRLDLGSANLTNAEMRGWSETVNALGNVTGATTVDLTLGNVITATTTGATTWTVTNASSSGTSSFTLILTNGGSQTQTWPSGTTWSQGVAPTLNSSDTDVLTFFTTNAGTTWVASKGGPTQADQVGQKLFVWGHGGNGRLGLGDGSNRSSPVQLSGIWSQASFGGFASSFMKVGGTIWTTGYNGTGYLGLTDLVTRSSPTQVVGTWLSCQTGYRSMFATRPDSSLWGWGFSSYGILGVGDTLRRSSPTQIAGTWRFAFTANYNSIGIKADGSLWTWGNNSDGGLGIQTSAGNRSSPVQISGTWIKAVITSSGQFNGAAIKADGSLWTWGSVTNGLLGIGDTTNGTQSSPVQVTGTWLDVGAGGRGTGFLAIKQDGSLWSWGTGGYGRNGNGLTIAVSSPVQIAGTWVALTSGSTYKMAFRSDSTLWAWGKNTNGELGVGDSINRSSPTQLTGTWMNAGNGFLGAVSRAFKF